jgi:hypothetical protein
VFDESSVSWQVTRSPDRFVQGIDFEQDIESRAFSHSATLPAGLEFAMYRPVACN